MNNPALAEDPENAAKISAWYWKKRVAPKGAGEDVTMARKAINGGLNGLDDTKKKTAEWEAKIAGSAGGSVTTAGASMPTVAGAGSPVAMPAIPTVVAANVPASVTANIPPIPDTPSPQAQSQSGTGAGRGVVNVSMAKETGQNIGDRGLAHIVTGGMGAA